eukprot:99541-Prorocentrum_minimum.AAC.1
MEATATLAPVKGVVGPASGMPLLTRRRFVKQDIWSCDAIVSDVTSALQASLERLVPRRM